VKLRRAFWSFCWLVSVFIGFLVGQTTASRHVGETSPVLSSSNHLAGTYQKSANPSKGPSNASTAPRPGIAAPNAKGRLKGLENEPSSQVPDSRIQDRARGDEEESIPFSEDTNVDSLSETIAEKLRKFLGNRGEVLSVDCAEYPCIAYFSAAEIAASKGLGNEFMSQMVQALADIGFSKSMIELSQRGDGTLAISLETDESKPLDSADVRKRVAKRVSEYFDEFDN